MIVTVFTGHRIDDPDRSPPRFPSTLATPARDWIGKRLREGAGYSSLASGGDILFQEACREAGLVRKVYLPLPVEQFLPRSVATEAPGEWEHRFHDLWESLPPDCRHIVTAPPEVNPFGHCNRAILAAASAEARRRGCGLRMLTIWDGKDSARPGGTWEAVALARAAGAEIEAVSPAELAADE